MRCPVCLSDSNHRVFRKYGYTILECDCGHRFADLKCAAEHVDRVYADEYFNAGGAGYPDYLGEAGIIRSQGRLYGQLLGRFTRPGRVLDVGAAAGFILEGLMDSGWQGVGLEPNTTMVAAAQRRGVDVRAGTLESLHEEQRFDVVTFIQVIAHFYDLDRALSAAAEATSDQGYWLIESWNKDSWMARLQGSHWHEYSPPSVLNYFSLETLVKIMARFGFTPIAHGRPPKKISGAHVRSLIQHSTGPRVLKSLATIVRPTWTLPYPSLDLFWVLLKRLSRQVESTAQFGAALPAAVPAEAGAFVSAP